MKKIFTKEWFAAAGIRALKTVAQTAVASIGVTAMIHEVDWVVVGSTAALAGVLSLLTSIAGLPEVSDNG
jgi:hypothetical protein